MSRHLVDELAVTEFISEVATQMQGSEMLAGTTRERSNVEGTEVKWPIIGRSRMVPKTHRADVLPANVPYDRPTSTMSDWHIAEFTDVFEDVKTNVDERKELAKTFALAAGRQKDEFRISALASNPTVLGKARTTIQVGSSANTQFDVREDPGTTPGNTKPAHLIGNAKGVLLNNECMPNDEYYALLPAPWYRSFASDPAFASQFYNQGQVSRTGMMPPGHGVDLKFMGLRTDSASDVTDPAKGGWNSAAGVGYVFAKSAIGIAMAKNPTIEVHYWPIKTSYLTILTLSMSSLMIDPLGVVRIENGPTS